MIDYSKFTKELKESVDSADQNDYSGPDVHAELLRIIFEDMKACWSDPKEVREEVLFVLDKVLP